MSKGKYKQKRERAQQHAKEEDSQANSTLCESVEANQERQTAKNANHERSGKQEVPMGLREIAKRSSITDWCLAVFTLALVAVAIYQYIILRGQLDVMQKDQRAWLAVGGDKDATFDPSTLHCPLAITDTGKTPALDVTADFYVEIVPNGYEPHFEGKGVPHTTFSIGAISTTNPQKVPASRYRLTGRGGEVADDPVSPDEKTRLDEGRAWLARSEG